MKRFWKTAEAVAADGGGWTVVLDGRPVKTPGRATLTVLSHPLAEAIAGEWAGQGEEVDPRSMPFYGLTNAVIDKVAPDPAAFAEDLGRYAEGDVLCYRADEPEALVARQAQCWDPILAWAQARFDVHFELVHGVLHRNQPPATLARLRGALAACSPWQLAPLSPLVTISGSLVTALMLLEGAIDADTAFAATHADELWQAENWGEDHFATKAREDRQRDFTAAAGFLALLRG